MEKVDSIYEVETVDEAMIGMLFKENARLTEDVKAAHQHIEFLTAECRMWRTIHEADQRAIESIIKQMEG